MALGTNYGFSFLDIVYFWKGSLEPYFEPYYGQLSVINPLIRITLILACIEAYFLYKDYKLNVIDKKITKL